MDFERFGGNQYMNDPRWPVNPMWKTFPALLAIQDPHLFHDFFDDFDTYTAAHWVITTTETGGASATEALTDGAGGLLLITNDDADNESDEFQQQAVIAATAHESWKLSINKPLWFEMSLAINDPIESDMLVGLCIADTEVIDGVTDGIYFLKPDDARQINYHCEKDSSDTTDDTGVDMVANISHRYGLYFDGAGRVEYWVDAVLRGFSTTNIPDDEELTISFGIQNGASAAKTLTADYVRCVQKR